MSHAGHTHTHSHTPVVASHNERKVLVSFFLIFGFMVVELVGGILSGSLALIADAGHMLADAGALALAYAAFRFGRRAADARRTFGYLRFEVLASLFNALTLFVIAGWVVHEAWQRVQTPHEVMAGPMLVVAVGGLLVNILVLWILTRDDHEHINIQGAVLHVVGDLLGSVGAITAAVVIYFTGWMMADPILSVAVALLILVSAWRLAAKSLHILLEGAPEGVSPEAISTLLETEVSDIESVSHVHVWQITAGQTLATLHVKPRENRLAQHVVADVEKALAEHFGIDHATVAVDWQDDSKDPCSLPGGETVTKRHCH